MPTVAVNGAQLYHEVRGDGPPVLLIMGATGVGGHFEQVARLLADEFTVVTYDRRGNEHSPRPDGWTATSPEEQADDAAALLDALGLSPAAVFGTSIGQASRRLAERLGLEVKRVPGAHAPYLDHARELGQAMRPFLREVSGLSA